MRVLPGMFIAVLLFFPRVVLGQTSDRPWEARRVFVDVNPVGSTSSDARNREFTGRFVTFGEAGFLRATYPKPSRSGLFPMLDVSGGYMAAPSIGLGAGLSRATFEDTAGLAATVPHPTFLNSHASDTDVTNRELKRTETAIHLFVASVPLRSSRVAFRIFGGPSFYWYKADMVRNILYSQTASPTSPVNAVTITGFSAEETKGNGIGFHVGSDVTYFVTELIGVKGGFRYSQSNVAVDKEPLSLMDQEIRVGGTLVYLGVRFRFGM